MRPCPRSPSCLLGVGERSAAIDSGAGLMCFVITSQRKIARSGLTECQSDNRPGSRQATGIAIPPLFMGCARTTACGAGHAGKLVYQLYTCNFNYSGQRAGWEDARQPQLVRIC
jgi:hypothetical protein